MDIRKRAALRVVEGGVSIAEAARESGLSWPTVKLWVTRAREQGVASLAEKSRRPKTIPGQVSEDVVKAVLALKEKRPFWGALKIAYTLWGDEPIVCVRTVDRILKRNNLVRPRGKAQPAIIRYERPSCNELWQIDFKGLGSPRIGYSPFSIIDDHSRFCLAFDPVPSHTSEAVWQVLWRVFQTYGLPEMILSDNEPCFHTSFGAGPSLVEARLWLLGIHTTHCRPAHPQTQGKVERFHRTVQDELGDALRQPEMSSAAAVYGPYVNYYNWERPHQSLGQKFPGSVYERSPRLRPSTLPVHQPQGVTRLICSSGKFCYQAKRYRAGIGLARELIDIRGQSAYYANVLLGTLEQMRV